MTLTVSMTDEELIVFGRNEASSELSAIGKVADQFTDSFVETIHVLAECTGKVIVTGSGTSSTIARRLAHLLSVTCKPGLFVHAMDALHGTMGAIEPTDVLIAISKGGESDEINNLCKLVHDKGTKLIGLGEHPESTFASLCDVFVHLHTDEGGDPENVIAMGSTLLAAVWGDALVRTMMKLNEWDVSEALSLHPAGVVGKSAEEILRQQESK